MPDPFLRLFQSLVWTNASALTTVSPLATNTLGRLSRLSAWWVRFGVLPEFIEPGKPWQNGLHERLRPVKLSEVPFDAFDMSANVQ
jgi:hypothetical protein